MAIGLNIRKFIYQNSTSGKNYEVTLSEATTGAVTGVGRNRGINIHNSDPSFDDTEVSFVVLTSALTKVFGLDAYSDSALCSGAFFNASAPAGTGAALSTLLT